MLWVLIRGALFLMSTHNMFSWRNKKNVYVDIPLIWSYFWYECMTMALHCTKPFIMTHLSS